MCKNIITNIQNMISYSIEMKMCKHTFTLIFYRQNLVFTLKN
jgi:hypothetical protein